MTKANIAKTPVTVHATCLVIGEAGLLIRGSSGSGKSRLAAQLIDKAQRKGRFSQLVGDDRIMLNEHNGRIMAQGHPAIAGLLERRGLGLTPEPTEAHAILRLIIDLVEAEPARLPQAEEMIETVCGVTLPRITLWASQPHLEDVLAALCLFEIAH
jgi:HPr kinase/phosphorylase